MLILLAFWIFQVLVFALVAAIVFTLVRRIWKGDK
jgi:hypothetical protein